MGASGYGGRRRIRYLRASSHPVLALGRHAESLPAGEGIEARPVDVADVTATTAALSGTSAAYYLLHARAGGQGFASRDRERAHAFGRAADAGLDRIVYLGGLGEDGDSRLSEYLSNRQEVGAILAASGVPVVELRAAVILGAGSTSFEMLRYLTEQLPAMVCPCWVKTRVQPFAEQTCWTTWSRR